MKNPKTVYFYWNAGYVQQADFVGWIVMRRNTGGKDTNKLGVGMKVRSNWLFNKPIVNKPPRGCKRGEYIIKPYHTLYRSYNDAWKKVHPMRKPTIETVKCA